MIAKDAFAEGLQRLRHPVLPLVAIVQFLYLTGEFATFEEIVAQLPEDIETGYTKYSNPSADLAPYLDLLTPLAALKSGALAAELVVDIHEQPVDKTTAVVALISQQILTRELEAINSALCAPCGCTLCCVGPEAGMTQAFFEIPLVDGEWRQFPVERIDSADSQARLADDETPLMVAGAPFYEYSQPRLIHWQQGWSLILPRASRCPNLEESGRCRVYPERPQVCRRPQIFPYVVEPATRQGQATARLRQSLLAVVDCPYVRQLQEEIAAYAAACELEMVFRHNKA